MTYAYGSQTKQNVPVSGGPVVFQTTNVSARLQDSFGNPLDTGTVQYYAGAWREFGTTSNGVAAKDLLPGTYSFRMTYASGGNDKQQDIAANPTVVFQTVKATALLQNSQGSPIDGGTVQYYAGAWRPFGTTSSGSATKELLPRNYSFRMTSDYVSIDKAQDLSANTTVRFSTVLCTVDVKNAQNQPVSGATVSYYAGAWRQIGQTVNGTITKELLPANLTFRVSYGGATQDKTQNLGNKCDGGVRSTVAGRQRTAYAISGDRSGTGPLP